jgi:hypothetical protein
MPDPARNAGASAAGAPPPLALVAVLDPRGRAAETLKRLRPHLACAAPHVRAGGRLALAADGRRRWITVRTGPRRDVILLGRMVSERVEPSEALDWAAAAVADGRLADLRTLQGHFALLLADWDAQTLTVVTDLLGAQPLYAARPDGRIVLSDRADAAVRLGGGRVDALGLAAWLQLGMPLADRTMFDGVDRLPAASVTVANAQTLRHQTYWAPRAGEESIGTDDLIDAVYEGFSRSFARSLRPFAAATVLLSGGFDSRLCLLEGLRQGAVAIDAASVPYSRAEREVVGRLAADTGVACQMIDPGRSIWDAFETLWFLHPDGYPVTRKLTQLCVDRLDGGRAWIDGSHSDVVMRSLRAGPSDGSLADPAAAREYVWRLHLHHRMDPYFRPAAARRLADLGRQAADEQSDRIPQDPKFCLRWDIATDERRQTAISFLQYADRAPCVEPFYDRTLMELRLRHPNCLYTHEMYRALLRRKFPGPGAVPHAGDLPAGGDTVHSYSRTYRRDLPAVLDFIRRRGRLLRKRRLLARVLPYAAGVRRHLYVLQDLMRLVKLEQHLAQLGIAPRWQELLS